MVQGMQTSATNFGSFNANLFDTYNTQWADIRWIQFCTSADFCFFMHLGNTWNTTVNTLLVTKIYLKLWQSSATKLTMAVIHIYKFICQWIWGSISGNHIISTEIGENMTHLCDVDAWLQFLPKSSIYRNFLCGLLKPTSSHFQIHPFNNNNNNTRVTWYRPISRNTDEFETQMC